MRRRTAAWLALVMLLALAGIALALRAGTRGPRAQVRATLSLAGSLGGADTAGFAHALAARPFRFPADHGPHPDFRTEWWYVTGNLVSAEGRRFGYELTFFRSALAPRPAPRASDWAARDVYMAHFTIGDSAGERFRAAERFERAAAGLAGASTAPWRVWVDDWSVSAPGEGRVEVVAPGERDLAGTRGAGAPHDAGGARDSTRAAPGFWPLHLVARDSIGALDLALAQGTAPVPQGEGGLSRKGPEPGDASYYYSLPRMPTSGWLEVGGRRYHVRGESWMDREWSTSALAPDEVGWDWFGLQLSDGRSLMLYRIRRRGGGISSFSAGTLVGVDGSARPLGRADAAVDVLGTWQSPLDGTRYPAGWHVRILSADLDLAIRPMLADQELNVSVRYWEGAVWLTGTAAGRSLAGRGFVELTGYGPAPRAPSSPGPR
jgi:predicted secreted hydrolase